MRLLRFLVAIFFSIGAGIIILLLIDPRFRERVPVFAWVAWSLAWVCVTLNAREIVDKLFHLHGHASEIINCVKWTTVAAILNLGAGMLALIIPLANSSILVRR